MSDGAPIPASGVLLRAGREDDVSFIFRLLRMLAEEVGESEHFAADVADILRDAFGEAPHFETLIAEVEGRPAGLATFFLTYSTYKGRPCLYVNDLIVDPWARGLSLGRLLMARICRIADSRKCCRVELRVLRDNPSRSFYERIGMAPSGEVPYVIKDDDLERLAATDLGD